MTTAKEVDEKLPGLKFTVKSKTIDTRGTLFPRMRGTIELLCEFEDRAFFDEAVEKLNNFKVYGTVTDEIIQALGATLNETDNALQLSQVREKELSVQLQEAQQELERLRKLLAGIGVELGLP